MPKKAVEGSQPRPPEQVHHTYTDRSQEKPSFIDPQYWRKIKGSSSSPFPVKVYNMLEQVEQEGLQHIVSWQLHGRCFLIHKQKEFMSAILPRYMNLTKFASFQRQLNLYGFGRITLGRDKGAYYHEYLLRGRGPLALEVQRVKGKSECVRGKANPADEPNLWTLRWLQSTNDEEIFLPKTTLDTSYHLPLLNLASNVSVDLCKEPFKVESCSSFQPFRDFHASHRELNDRPRSQNYQMSTATDALPQFLMQRNQSATAKSNCQTRTDLCDTTEASMNCGMPLVLSNEHASYIQTRSVSDFRSSGECDILDLLTGPLCSDLFGQHVDIEPLTPQASADQDIFLDKTDILDMIEMVESL